MEYEPGIGPFGRERGPRHCRLVDPVGEPHGSPRRGCGAGTASRRASANLGPMTSELKVVTTVSNQAEAEMVCESLAEAGIRSMPQMSGGNIRLGAAAPLDVYVEQHDFAKALAVLNAAVPSDEELTRLSDEAGDKSAP
jgi:hypothetical protein